MKSLMNFQSASSGVPFCAPRVRTFEGLLTCVSQLMSLQMPFGDELLVALLAYKRSLSRVCAHMRLQISCLRELLQTLLKRTNQDLLFFLRSFNLFDMCYRI